MTISLSLILILFLSIPSIKFNVLLIVLISITIIGFIGQIIDSLLGALLQNKYYCPRCNLVVEEPKHQVCQSENLQKTKKYTFLNNNTVNITANTVVMFVMFVLVIITNFNPF